MIALSDIDVLDRFAGRLFIPFFSIAFFLQPPFSIELIKGESFIILIVNFIISFFISAVALVIIHRIITYMDVCWCGERLFPILGLFFIGFGLLLLCKLGGKDPLSGVSFFWNLASLSYGFLIFQIINRTSKLEINKSINQ